MHKKEKLSTLCKRKSSEIKTKGFHCNNRKEDIDNEDPDGD